jgi:DNA polymerase
MLRELELLPVWRLRSPLAETLPLQKLPETAAITAPEVAVMPVVKVAVDVVAETLVVQEDPVTSVAQINVPEIAPEPLVQSPWLLYCPQAADAQSQQLLQNIVRALQLPAEDLVLQQQVISLGQVKTRFCVLFGLEAANQFLNAEHWELESVRGQLHTLGDMAFVITHHPRAMLENPALKKEVWQDLCLLLAQKEVGLA